MLVDRRRPLAEVRARGRPGRARRGRRALRGPPPGPRRPGARHLAAVHRAGLADAGAWSTPRATSSRSTPARATRTPSTRLRRRAASPSTTRQGHPAPRRLARTSPRRRARRDAALPRPRSSALPGGTFLVADAGHHRLVELAADGETVVRRIGSGERGLVDGGRGDGAVQRAATACACCPTTSLPSVGYDVVVADTVNHALRGVRLATGAVRTLAGDRPAVDAGCCRTAARPVVARGTSPGGDEAAVVGRDGRHPPAVDASTRATGAVDVSAGHHERRARRRPGCARPGSRRRPASPPTADRLWLADTETSSLRYVDDGDGRAPPSGTGLFDFGHVDGPAATGAAAAPARRDRRCRTGRWRCATPTTARSAATTRRRGAVTTLATGLAEPSDAVARRRAPAGRRVGARTGSPGCGCRPRRWSSTAVAHRTQRPVTEVGAGRGRARGGVHAAAGPEARRPLRPADPAGGLGDAAGAAAGRRRAGARSSPGADARRARR